MKLIFVYLVACFSVPVWSLYEDQIGKFDWLHRGLGSVHFAEFDLSSSSEGGPAKRIAVATKHNVLAVLNANKNGEILWRQVLEEGDEGTVESMLLSGSEVSIVTGNPPLLRSFDLNKAALIKEIPMAMSFKPTESYGNRLVSHVDGVITVVHLTEGAAEVNVFSSATGTLHWQHTLLQPWISPHVQCALTTPSLVCVSASLGRVFSLPLSDPGTGGRDSKENVFISTHLETLGVHLLDADSNEGGEGSGAGDESCPHLDVPLTLQDVHGSHQHLLLKWRRGSVLLLCGADGDVSVVQQVGAAPLAISVAPDGTLYKAVQDRQAVRISAVSPSSGSELVSLGLSCSVPLSGEAVAGVRLLAVQQYSRRGDGELAARALLVLDDDSVHAVAASGVLWSREEALSSVLATEAVDLPVPASSMSMYDHVAQRAGLLHSLRQRVSHQLHELLLWVGDALEGSLSGGDGGAAAADAAPALNRDDFNLHKLLVVATAPGKVFALDNLSGAVVWSAYLPPVRPLPSHKMLLFLQRSVAHFPHPPQMALVAMQKGSCNGVLYTFNPLTGEAVAGGLQLLPCPVNQAAMLAQNDNQFIKPVLVVSPALSVHVFPASAEATVVLPHKDVLYVTTRTDTHLAGYSLRSSAPGALSLSLVWRSHFPPGRITAVHAKRPGDRVHSSGRVMADRSVLYKYTNPNLAVVVSRGQEGGVKNAMAVYLVDLVSGAVVDWVTHGPVSGPVHVVHTENWALYTYHNDRARRHEVYSLELFEGPSQGNASAFSSLSPPLQPRVERQAFLLPVGVRAAAHTVTERSITSKHVLLALETGGIAQVARWFVDPRRPLTASGPREEGLMPYAPEIPLPPTELLTYNLSLPRVTAIHTAPAGLESTSIVFVYGLDLFSSRVFPSKMFDMLKDDFDYFLIVAVLLSLAVAAAVTRKLAQRKALFQLWK